MKKSKRERILAKTEEQDGHLIWNGGMHQHHPHFKGVGNPVRILLDIDPDLIGKDDCKRIQVRPNCSHPRCIDPYHWRVIIEDRIYFQGLPPVKWKDPRQWSKDFTNRELEDIELMVEEIREGVMTLDELEGECPDKILNEVQKRVQNAQT